MEEEPNLQEQIFHNTVRENIIFMLLFLLLYLSSYTLIGRFRRRDREEYLSSDEDEAMVYRISLWLCTFSLAVSVGAALLLPISIASNEVLIMYPNSYYVKWLNSSLIQGLWNHVFLFSNLSLFVLLPFAYLFTESEGFAGSRKGLMGRVYETVVVLFLLGIVVLGLTYIISALLDKDKSSIQTLLNLWSYYLPFLYSCVSFLGVLMLLICTPLGFGRLFGVVSLFLIKPQFLRDLNEEYSVAMLEEECLKRRLKQVQESSSSTLCPPPMMMPMDVGFTSKYSSSGASVMKKKDLLSLLKRKLNALEEKRKLVDKQRSTSWLQRNLVYPVAMLLLIALTCIAVLMVVQNTLELLIGMKALPLSTRQFTLGITSLSMLGPFGAALEIVLILYLFVTSSIGLYTLPLLSRVRPRLRQTALTHVIANCCMLLVLSSALPVLSRILGITNFDLLGDFGSIEWLGNFKIVLLYNLAFASAATLCLMNKFTVTVRKELYARFRSFFATIFEASTARKSTKTSNSPTKED